MTNRFPQPISEQIWNNKYRLITSNPDIPNDVIVSDTWNRIAKACAYPINSVVHSDVQKQNERDYRSILEDFLFLPAGRIIAGAGSGRNVTLFNCYVMGTIPDDIHGIFDMLREAALTMQQGGGIGYDFSTLRPAGSPVRGVDSDASGPLTFMDVWDSMCKTIMSAGARRGAMMATMRCDHPDIEAFITAKKDETRFRMFNMSVLCTDAFMDAVKSDLSWNLVHIKSPPFDANIVAKNNDGVALFKHKTIRARDLWNLIMDSTYNHAEPGVLFIDRINQRNNLWYAEDICATNPCGEQPLPPYGACLLGSINLTQIIKEPFINPWIDFTKLASTAATAVSMLDAVIDISNFPIEQQKVEALDKRRMGIGITGLADMLFMMGVPYGTPEAANIAGDVMETITLACYEKSIQMAKEFRPCPATETSKQREHFIQSGFMAGMPSSIKTDILKYGIRNALLTSIAPTGTISLYAGNISSGIEPIFAQEYTRKILEDDGVTKREEVIQDYAVHLLGTLKNTHIPVSKIMDELVTAQTLSPADHLSMLSAIQPWIDSSISKTINCPRDISMEDFQEIYMTAFDMGLKGCTTYRPNDVTGSVLSLESDEPEEDVDGEEANPMLLQHPITEPMDRPDNLTGITYKLKWDGKSYYVTMNDFIDAQEKVIPFEIFIHSSSMESLQWTVALTRMVSAVFRRGGQVRFIGEELKRISDPTGGAWVNKKYVPSFVALLGQCITDHLTALDRVNELGLGYEQGPAFDGYVGDLAKEGYYRPHDKCPECNAHSMIISDRCNTCLSCGHSKCG